MVSRAADYALRVVLVLASHPSGTRMSLADLAGECEVPSAFLYKVLRALVEKDVLVAHRGKSGGYELAPGARQRSVLYVVDALDGLSPLNVCLTQCACPRAATCPAHPVWRLAQQQMRDVLACAVVDDLVRASAPGQSNGRHKIRLHPGEARERLARSGGRACARLRRDERLPAPPRGRDVPGVLAGSRGDGR